MSDVLLIKYPSEVVALRARAVIHGIAGSNVTCCHTSNVFFLLFQNTIGSSEEKKAFF